MGGTKLVMPTTGAAEEGTPAEPGRSPVGFPYLGLDNALAVARAVHRIGGGRCQRNQVAAQLRLKNNGGGFYVRLNSAQTFGLITYDFGNVALTHLGHRICDPKEELQARVEAFLSVPLYRALYDNLKGAVLPAKSRLESLMVSLGVPPKHRNLARRAFQRAANQSGFFAHGGNRLVMPHTKTSGGNDAPGEYAGDGSEIGEEEEEEEEDGSCKLDPLIEGLLDKLPPADTAWSAEARKKWLQTAAHIFDLMYSGDGSDDELRITITRGSLP